MNNIASLQYFLPELVLVGGVIFLLLFELVTSYRKALPYMALWVLAIAFLSSIYLLTGNVDGYLFNNLIRINGFTVFFKLLFLTATFLTILFPISDSIKRSFTCHSERSEESTSPQDKLREKSKSDSSVVPLGLPQNDSRGIEYYILLLITNLGLFLLSSANDLLMVYVGLETVSICSYMLVASHKGNIKSSEAGLKYVIFGAIASGVMLYGMALLYGLYATTSLDGLVERFNKLYYYDLMVSVSLFMVFVGLGYKIAAVPVHMWCPDVYEGAPTEITAFLSVAPKAAGFAILIRFFYYLLHPVLVTAPGSVSADFINHWQIVLAVISVLTMTVGNLAALHQTNLKRLLAYSSIAHAGYILMGLVILSSSGIQGMVIYLAIYLLMNMGAFLVIYIIENLTGSVEIGEYEGLGWRMPFLGVVLSIFLFSLVGLPPFGGFIAKFYVFSAVINEGWYILAVIGLMNGVVSLYYYARIVRAMFLKIPADIPHSAIRTPNLFNTILLLLLVIPVLVLGVYWPPLLNIINKALGI